jgi:hypothetical protein
MWENFLKILLGKAKGRIDSLKVKEASNYIRRGKETMDRPDSTYIKINTLPSTTPPILFPALDLCPKIAPAFFVVLFRKKS